MSAYERSHERIPTYKGQQQVKKVIFFRGWGLRSGKLGDLVVRTKTVLVNVPKKTDDTPRLKNYDVVVHVLSSSI